MKGASCILGPNRRVSQSVIIQHFATKSLVFMFLGASCLKNRVLALVVGLCTVVGITSCGGSSSTSKVSGLPERVLASQGVTTNVVFGGLVIVNGTNDTIARIAPIGAGTSPGTMAISPSRNIVAAFDAASNSVFAVDTTKETDIGSNGVKLPGPTSSFIVPTANQIGYAAVPSAAVNGFAYVGAIAQMNFASGSFTTIAVNNAQTVVANSAGTQLLVFSGDSDSMTVLNPLAAVPPVDTSCYYNPPNAVCTIVPGFDRPVYAVINNNTAYVLNCGPQCGGKQASVMFFDLPSLTITKTIPVDAATIAVLNKSTLYVAGTSPTNNACTGQQTAATTCGRLDVIDLGTGTVTATYVITDGYHWRMDMTSNGQLFVGSRNCTNIGNVNIGGGEIRGCLTILDTVHNRILIPGDNGDVVGLQSFSSRFIEYVAQGGHLRVYTTYSYQDGLLINVFVPLGTINVVGNIGDVKAIDFF